VRLRIFLFAFKIPNSKPGVRVWDEYKQEHFGLRALF